MIWFTADTHFSHVNVIRYSKRPFDNVDQMNNTLVNNWNSCVKDDDTVYFLGDFCFGDARIWLPKLKGNILFVRGSHDKSLINAVGIKNVPYVRVVKLLGQTIVMSHCCFRVWEKSHFDSWHLYAHSHGTLPPIGKSMDVGVDCNDYQPMSLNQVKEYMSKRPHNFNWVRNNEI